MMQIVFDDIRIAGSSLIRYATDDYLDRYVFFFITLFVLFSYSLYECVINDTSEILYSLL